MTSPDHTLWHPHPPHELYEPLSSVLDWREFEQLCALTDDNQRAVEDIVNNPAYTLTVHITAPTTGQESDRYYVAESLYLVKATASLTTAGTTTSTIDVRRNGAAITPAAQFSLVSGAHTGVITPHQFFDASAGDYVTVKASTVGTGAAGFVVLLIFQPIA